MKADHLRNSNSLTLPNLENALPPQKTNNSSKPLIF